MNDALNRNVFFVKEHTGMFKAANEFDISDPDSRQVVLECREPELGLLTRMLRFTDYKRMTPFKLVVRTPGGPTLLEVQRGVSLFLSKVTVADGQGRVLGGFQQRMFSIGGKFDVLDPDGRPLCTLQGKWTGWEFSFKNGEREVARVTKKWAGFGREFFTSADNYALQISENVRPDDPLRPLILAAVLVIDMVLKE